MWSSERMGGRKRIGMVTGGLLAFFLRGFPFPLPRHTLGSFRGSGVWQEKVSATATNK